MKTQKKARVGLKDLAREVGVHVSTVSRALNPDSGHPVAPTLIEKIRKASKRLGYRQNLAAYSLKTNRSRTIGVVVPDITDAVFPPIIRGIEDGLAQSGYVAMLANTDSDMRRQVKVLETMRARGVDGLILASVLRSDKLVSRLADGLPVVTVSRRTDDPRFSSVVHDEDDGIGRLLTHLVSLGHRDIACIAGPQTVSTGFNRYSAFMRHRDLAGLQTRPALVSFARAFNEIEGERCAEQLLVAARPFTAVVCANDRLAIGAISALRRHGIACPSEVSVTGFNDMPLVDRLSPSLTTVRVQHYKAGFEAADVLVDLIENGASAPHHLVLPVEAVVRSSTARVRGATKRKVTEAAGEKS
ncbi:LacI family DNA-binding transcriptional regulator [Pseudorhodoplanes sp.]|uniref:LacI family DNA-binding transcriptional regulator n=1 Tax=Pseudorhodoplanes sp. TaxID=1934341 RepID=UPI003919D9F3